MKLEFQRIKLVLKTGDERFVFRGSPAGYTLLEFWRWSVSDLVSNATRGRLAEFIVAKALGIATSLPRDEWAAHDLTTPAGIKIEVKSAAYLQSWAHRDYSTIQFATPKTRAWDPETNKLAPVAERQAQVYVFALLAHKDKQTLDPLDLDQWMFYILPTETLNNRTRSQHSITLSSLERLCGPPVKYEQLASRVDQIAAMGSGSNDSHSEIQSRLRSQEKTDQGPLRSGSAAGPA